MALNSKVTPPTHTAHGPSALLQLRNLQTYVVVTCPVLSLAPFPAVPHRLPQMDTEHDSSLCLGWGCQQKWLSACRCFPPSADPLQVLAWAGIAYGSPLVLPCVAVPLLVLSDHLATLHDLDLHYCRGKYLSPLLSIHSEYRKRWGRERKGLQRMETCCLRQCPCKIAEGPIDIALGFSLPTCWDHRPSAEESSFER